MPKYQKQFEEFLTAIEPDGKAVSYAQEAHRRVREHLATDDKFKDHVVDSFLYGSYRRKTAVGDIKDVDIVILTDFDPAEPDNTPDSVLKQLKAAINRHYKDTENQQYQRRSIRVDDPLPETKDAALTLDVIPAFAPNGDDKPLKVPDRELGEWIDSHPKGHIAHAQALNENEDGRGQFVPLAKMMKWWWKHQTKKKQPSVARPKPKGFWVECLAGENFMLSESGWADLLTSTLSAIVSKYASAQQVPVLDDPGLVGEKFKTNMTIEEFEMFITAAKESLEKANEAMEMEDEDLGAELWREVLGEKFPKAQKDGGLAVVHSSESGLALGDVSHRKPPRWPLAGLSGGRVSIEAESFDTRGRNLGKLLPYGTVFNGYKFQYMAMVSGVSEPYEIHWQVVNTGSQAMRAGGLRGEFFSARNLDGSPSRDKRIDRETASYHGIHWIECFVVKDGRLVARSGPFYVRIINRAVGRYRRPSR